MNKKSFTIFLFLVVVSTSTANKIKTGMMAMPDYKPNIIIIMADDLGYGALGAYGSNQVSTPNIDALAANGRKFTDYHSNGSVCTPTRASLITGQYPQRLIWVEDSLLSPVFVTQRNKNLKQRWAWGISLDQWTLADMMKSANYKTALFGKWHLGYDTLFHPMNQGFDEFRGWLGGSVDYHTHIAVNGLKELDWWDQKKINNETGYSTDLLTKYAVNFIATNKETPFFLYLSHGAPHTPIQGRNPNSKKSTMDTYIEMIEILDESVGEVVNTLESLNLSDNTLVIFLSDNGPQGHHLSNGGLKGLKGGLDEGGHRVPFIASWPGIIPKGTTSDQVTMTMDLFPTIANLTGAYIPQGYKIDGVDMMPILRGNSNTFDRTVHWRLGTKWAVRKGPWKLIGDCSGGMFLSNLEDKISESVNYLSQQPQLVQELTKLNRQWTSTTAQYIIQCNGDTIDLTPAEIPVEIIKKNKKQNNKLNGDGAIHTSYFTVMNGRFSFINGIILQNNFEVFTLKGEQLLISNVNRKDFSQENVPLKDGIYLIRIHEKSH